MSIKEFRCVNKSPHWSEVEKGNLIYEVVGSKTLENISEMHLKGSFPFTIFRLENMNLELMNHVNIYI